MCNERGYDAGEHVAAAGGCHAGVARAVDVHFAVAAHGHGVMTFEHDGESVEFRHLDGFKQAFLLGAVGAKQAVELAGVRR